MFLGSRYDITSKLGDGTYGEVYKVKDLQTNQWVAVKRFKSSTNKPEDGVSMQCLREISLSKELKHPNVINVQRVVDISREIYVFMDFCDCDLYKLLERGPLPEKMAKFILHQILRGTDYCHSHRVLHRDLKPRNILVQLNPKNQEEPVIKLTDFGLARQNQLPVREFTHEVCTLWYRPPEILMGQSYYGTSIDVWAIGCIFVEMLLQEPLFPGHPEFDQLLRIQELLGQINEDNFPGVNQLPGFSSKFPNFRGEQLAKLLKGRISADGLDLVNQLLLYDPSARITCRKALQHSYFTSDLFYNQIQ